MKKPKETKAQVQPFQATPRFLVLLSEGLEMHGVSFLKAVGLRTASSADFPACAVCESGLGDANAVVFDKLGVAVVTGDADQMQRLASEIKEGGPVLAVEPVRQVHALGLDDRLASYLHGFQDGVSSLIGRLDEFQKGEILANLGSPALGESEFTWGLTATRVPESKYTGKGIRVSVLDTGFDLKHPDFPNRVINAKSFVPNEDVQDGHGHGTHCIGTSCGPATPFHKPRYGIAYDAEIYPGKVLDSAGSGNDAWILAGINWAITEKCRVISMSLGAAVSAGEAYSKVFERVAKRALKAGTLIVAAAGNESNRPQGVFSPVGHPANCPSILAVGALDVKTRLPYFTNRGTEPGGGQVDIAAPGVEVLSAFLMPERVRSLSGTSMATPHVAGIVALLAEANPEATALELWTLLTQTARRIPLLASDVGAGLVQAP